MLAAVIRAKELEQSSKKIAQPAGAGDGGELQARPAVEAAKVLESERGSTENCGTTPLMRAACKGLAGTVQALIDRGAEVNAKRSDGFNALALAAFFGHSQVAWLLLENGADLAATGRSETSPETWADARGYFEIGDAIRESRAAESVRVSTLSTAMIDEAARFSRPAEDDKLDDPSTGVRTAAIDEALHFVRADENEEPGHQRSAELDKAARFCGPTGSENLGDQTAAIDEATRFSRPVENKELGNEKVATNDTDSETASAMRPASLREEGTSGRTESAGDIIENDKAEYHQEHFVIQPSLRPPKALPEIEDPPRLVVPKFNPGSAFVTRVTSSVKTLVGLSLVVLLAGTVIAAFLFPNVRQFLTGGQTESVARTTELARQQVNPVAASETTASTSLESPSAAITEPRNAPTSNDIEKANAYSPTENKQVGTTSRNESVKESDKGLTYSAAAEESESRAHSSSESKIHAGSEDKSDSAAPQVSRSRAAARKPRAVARAIKLKPQIVSEEQPKPAPLSVETSRSRTVASAPAENSNDVRSTQSQPSSLISGKPKSKVIQWP